MQNVFGLRLIGCHSKVVFWCPFQSWSWITLAFSPFGQNLHSWYGNSRFWGLKKTEYFAKHIMVFMILNLFLLTLPLSRYNHYHFPLSSVTSSRTAFEPFWGLNIKASLQELEIWLSSQLWIPESNEIFETLCLSSKDKEKRENSFQHWSTSSSKSSTFIILVINNHPHHNH